MGLRTSGPFIDIGAYESAQACLETTAAIAIDQDHFSSIPLSTNPVSIFDMHSGCRTMGVFTALNTELLTDNYLYSHANVEAETPAYEGHPYVRRCYDLRPPHDSDNDGER